MKLNFSIYLETIIFAIIFCILGVVLGRVSISYFPPVNLPGMHHRGDGPPSEREMSNRIAKDLKLTKEQKQQVEVLFSKHRPEMEKQMKLVQSKFEEINASLDVQMKTILTQEQYGDFIKYRRIPPPPLGNRRPPPPPRE